MHFSDAADGEIENKKSGREHDRLPSNLQYTIAWQKKTNELWQVELKVLPGSSAQLC